MSNTTLPILSIRAKGTPPPFTDKIFGKKGVTDLGGHLPPFFKDFSLKIFLQKVLQIVFFAQKNTWFWF